MKAQRGIKYPAGVSGRTSSSPVRHALTGVRASRTGRNLLALCGASLRQALHEDFVPGASRACPRCSASIVEANK